MTAEFIASQRTGHGVPHTVSCRALGIPALTFYKHFNRPPTAVQQRRAALDAQVREAFDDSEGTYGSPRVRAQLRRDGAMVSKKTVEASMFRQGLCARPERKKGLTSANSSGVVRRTCFAGTSTPADRPEVAAETSNKSPPRRALCSSRPSRTCTRAAWSGSPPPTTTRQQNSTNRPSTPP